jgi:hypothetical protein
MQDAHSRNIQEGRSYVYGTYMMTEWILAKVAKDPSAQSG